MPPPVDKSHRQLNSVRAGEYKTMYLSVCCLLERFPFLDFLHSFSAMVRFPVGYLMTPLSVSRTSQHRFHPIMYIATSLIDDSFPLIFDGLVC